MYSRIARKRGTGKIEVAFRREIKESVKNRDERWKALEEV